MTIHDKVMYIIERLELSDSDVAQAILKSRATATHKRMKLRYNKFTNEDYQLIREFYIKRLKSIENLDK
nr:hypothetical protein [uncultured Capnocytophaga sp.]